MHRPALAAHGPSGWPMTLLRRDHRSLASERVVARRRPHGLAWLGGAEVISGLLGFGATLQVGRRLGPGSFGRVEAAAAAAAWVLVLVRSGVETIVVREVARRPGLARPMTDALIGIKLACAAAGHVGLILAAILTGRPLVAAAGLVLWPSALAADVGARAAGRLRFLSASLIARASAMFAASSLVRGPGDAISAALLATAGESLVALICRRDHTQRYGPIRPRLRRRECRALGRRGLSASLIRFGRVGVYGADLIAMGTLGAAELGPFAAARRVVFAAISVGLVVPTASSPSLARAWAAGLGPAREEFRAGLLRLAAVGLSSTIALMLMPSRGIALVFGPAYAGPWLAVIAARLPFLLTCTYAQCALIACRRERVAQVQSGWVCGLALVAVPASTAWAGATGAALSCLVVEAVGATLGMLGLRRLSLVGAEVGA